MKLDVEELVLIWPFKGCEVDYMSFLFLLFDLFVCFKIISFLLISFFFFFLQKIIAFIFIAFSELFIWPGIRNIYI